MIDNGTYVIVRCRYAGVHAGILMHRDGSTVVLKQSRRLWKWVCKKGDFLCGVAKHGLSEDSVIGGTLDDIMLLDACEIIPATLESIATIRNLPAHRE